MTLAGKTEPCNALNHSIAICRNLGGGFVESMMAYDGEGRKVSETDALGRTNFMDHDELGRLVRVRAPESKMTMQIYDPSSNLVETVLSHPVADQIRRFSYDAANRLITRTDATDAQTRLDYDDAGNVVRETDGRGIGVEHEYDVRNRRITSTLATAAHGPIVRRFDYDAVGNLVEETWPNSNVVTSTYDALNRLVTKEDSSVGHQVFVTAFEYDPADNLTREVDRRGNETTFIYDERELAIVEQRPLEATMTFAYGRRGD